MKGLYTDIIDIRRKVFAETALFALEDRDLKELPRSVYNIIPGEEPKFRTDIFKERAIVAERMRQALGLDIRDAATFGLISDGVEHIDVDVRIYEPPLINVISFACEACPTKTYEVTSSCRRCLGHPCQNICPVNAVTIDKKQAIIDTEKCIKCGKCKDVCPYGAIIKFDRPCAESCGVNAIESDHLGRATINHEKCVSCGQCMQACPFAAIGDKSQIYQLVKALKKEDNMYAIVAPAFVGQFGPMVSPSQLFEGIKLLGFKNVVEVGLGADIGTIHEAEEFLAEVPGKRPYMGTSCCPSWKFMVEKMFPDQAQYISDTATPMIATAQFIKNQNPKAKVVFIGPCIAKKLEALGEKMSKYIDFVVTFEELMGIFVACNLELSELEALSEVEDASALGRGFASAGGVAKAVRKTAEEIDPSRVVQIESANGLQDCVKMMRLAKAGKKNGMLLEGMACPGGCIGGPGTIISIQRAQKALNEFCAEATETLPTKNLKIKK